MDRMLSMNVKELKGKLDAIPDDFIVLDSGFIEITNIVSDSDKKFAVFNWSEFPHQALEEREDNDGD